MDRQAACLELAAYRAAATAAASLLPCWRLPSASPTPLLLTRPTAPTHTRSCATAVYVIDAAMLPAAELGLVKQTPVKAARERLRRPES